MIKRDLNVNDQKLLAFCRDTPRSVNELAKLLQISPASVSIKVDALEKDKLVEVRRQGRGKKTVVKTIKKGATQKYMVDILNKIKNNGGYVSFDEFTTIPELFYGCEDYLEKSKANTHILYSNLIERRICLSSEGEKFLKENSK